MLIRNPNLHIRRFEFKYLVAESDLDGIRRAISNFVILDPYAQNAKNGRYLVLSLYLDDTDLSAYFEKMAGLKMRKKFRIRTYSDKVVDSTGVYIEIKRRDGTIIFKDRSPLAFGNLRNLLVFGDYDKIKESGDPLVTEQFLGYFLRKKLKPTLITCYDREAYLDQKNFSFRLTLDLNLRAKIENTLSLDNSGCKEILRGHAILEAKFNRIMPAWFGMIVRSHGLERIAFSKYCWSLENCGIVPKSEAANLIGLWT